MADLLVSDTELAEISRLVSSVHMYDITTKYLGLEKDELGTERIENQWIYNYNALSKWKKKNRRKATKQVIFCDNSMLQRLAFLQGNLLGKTYGYFICSN